MRERVGTCVASFRVMRMFRIGMGSLLGKGEERAFPDGWGAAAGKPMRIRRMERANPEYHEVKDGMMQEIDGNQPATCGVRPGATRSGRLRGGAGHSLCDQFGACHLLVWPLNAGRIGTAHAAAWDRGGIGEAAVRLQPRNRSRRKGHLYFNLSPENELEKGRERLLY